jgi:Protein of unknown function (DUF1214)
VTANTAKMLIVASLRKIKCAGFFIGVLSRCCFRLVGFNPRTTGLSTEKFQVSAGIFQAFRNPARQAGWSLTVKEMSELGADFEYRAVNAAIEIQEALEVWSGASDEHQEGSIPPVNAFWSITLYDQEGFQVANSLNRFAVSSWMPFQYNPDGSLDLYFQNESPGAEKEANWLPAPKGPFNLCMRLYAPRSEALTGKWNPPPVMRVQEVSPLATQ